MDTCALYGSEVERSASRRPRIILFYLHFCLHLSYAYRWNQEMMVYLNMLALRSRALPFL
jgi:hypothetical protein